MAKVAEPLFCVLWIADQRAPAKAGVLPFDALIFVI